MTACRTDSVPTSQCETLPKPSQPAECQSALNLTEPWRIENNGGNIQPNGVYTCDFADMNNNYTERPWFRFAGEAGNVMLDSCPPPYSCGTHVGMWTDQEMPSVVGEVMTTVAFGSWSNNCKMQTRSILVMRCSYDTLYDLIYQYNEDWTVCQHSFCGMLKN